MAAGIVLGAAGWFFEGTLGAMVGWGFGVVFAGLALMGLGEYAAWRFDRARSAPLDRH